MGKIDYQAIYERNRFGWHAMTEEPQRYIGLLAGHYSDGNHFVYELLQNAEDACAETVVIEYHSDRLVFRHDGKPFDEADVRGVCAMADGTKDRHDAQTIGRFGMGFKSVYKYTSCPEIYSDDESFVIQNFLLSEEIKDGWDYQAEKEALSYSQEADEDYRPFVDSKHLTKIVIPFQERTHDNQIVPKSGQDVLDKLGSLSGEILLFLTHIKDLYWTDCESERHVHIALHYEEGDEKRITCRRADSENESEEITKYLKYRKVFDHAEMHAAEVSVVYKLNAQGKNINEMPHTPIWVYFPTLDMTYLPFLIHGSFETAVSREKLMFPSEFNNDLFGVLGDLIADSMRDLAERKLITQAFLRNIVLPSFKDGSVHVAKLGLKEKITNVFLKHKLLPDQDGIYRSPNELTIAVPFSLADQRKSLLWQESFVEGAHFVAFNDENASRFTDYFNWLRDDLHIRIFDIRQWTKKLCELSVRSIELSGAGLEDIERFYSFLWDYDSRPMKYFRATSYETALQEGKSSVWSDLRKAPIFLNAENCLVPAVAKNGSAIYLGTASSYQTLRPAEVLHPKMAKSYRKLFEDSFDIPVFDNYRYAQEKILPKYRNVWNNEVVFREEEKAEKEYIDDLRVLLELTNDMERRENIVQSVQYASIIKIKTEDGVPRFAAPHSVYMDMSDEKIDLQIYFAPACEDWELDDEANNFSCCNSFFTNGIEYKRIDEAFYRQNGISLNKLRMLGVLSTPVTDGRREGEVRRELWWAIGAYCPHIDVIGLETNLKYIASNPQEEMAKRKSAEILKLFLRISNKLTGEVKRRKSKPYIEYGEAEILGRLRTPSWLFDKTGELRRIQDMSRYELNEEIYGELSDDKTPYAVLGFAIKSADETKELVERFDSLDEETQKSMFCILARKQGYDVTVMEQPLHKEGEGFDLHTSHTAEFPQRPVKNMGRLIHHVQQDFLCADKVRYEKVLRSIRTSKPVDRNGYVKGMYCCENGRHICQRCKEETTYVEAVEIANLGIELAQIHLCLCPVCARRYKSARARDSFKEEAVRTLENAALGQQEACPVTLAEDCTVYFTETHLAEVQEILRLLRECDS
jgi:hypothetical protein